MFYIILLLTIILDQISKWVAMVYLENKQSIIWDFIYLEYIENPWIAFWIKLPFLKVITIILILWIFYYYRNEKKDIWEENRKWFDISFALILWWAIGNAIERISNWFVIDFIWVQSFSVFNLADSFITLWACLYFYILYKNNKK